MFWLLVKSVFDKLQEAAHKAEKPSAEQLRAFEEEFNAIGEDLPRGMSIIGNTAALDVVGVLTDAPDYYARWYGGGNTTYGQIRSGIAVAESDPSISEIVLQINSPGGSASAELFETAQAIAATSKPVKAVVGNMAASAAYWLASQADEIVAQNEMSKVGSIGVVQRNLVLDWVVETTSSNAPNKRPDATTEEGQAQIREFIDQIEAKFIQAVSEGRGVSEKTVKADFGRGGLVLAGEAQKVNMLDSVLKVSAGVPVTSGNGSDASEQEPRPAGNKEESSTMDLNELKAKHPAAYAEAVAEGVSQERDRCSAHITLGSASGAMDIATKAIKEGTGLTAGMQAEYMAAGMAKDNLDQTKSDDSEASDAADGADSKDETETSSAEAVLALVEQGLGVDDNE